MMKHNRVDKKLKEFYQHCFGKLASNVFVETIAPSQNACHLIIKKLKLNFEQGKELENLLQ